MPAKKNAAKMVTEAIVVLVTCGSTREARKIARTLVEHKLAACVNLLPTAIESVYRWKGQIDSAREFLLIVKTTRKRFAAVQSEICRLHSYDVPEIIALPIISGSRDYLRWIAESVAATES
jgi:periplasmic divalent cation tolerance protein